MSSSSVSSSKASLGVYQADIKTDHIGQWSYKWTGNVGKYLAVCEGVFQVAKTSI